MIISAGRRTDIPAFFSEWMNYFQFTLDPHGGDLEAYLPSLSARIDTFQTLSRYLGKERVLWRYDPIIVNGKYTIGWHIEEFRRF